VDEQIEAVKATNTAKVAYKKTTDLPNQVAKIMQLLQQKGFKSHIVVGTHQIAHQINHAAKTALSQYPLKRIGKGTKSVPPGTIEWIDTVKITTNKVIADVTMGVPFVFWNRTSQSSDPGTATHEPAVAITADSI
jgi:predicted RNA binding protein YcfA (HicA-like mRNA interferase family)